MNGGLRGPCPAAPAAREDMGGAPPPSSGTPTPPVLVRTTNHTVGPCVGSPFCLHLPYLMPIRGQTMPLSFEGCSLLPGVPFYFTSWPSPMLIPSTLAWLRG